VSRYQKRKANLDSAEAKDRGWHWHQLAHNASLNRALNRYPHEHPTIQFFTGRMCFLPPNRQSQN